MSNEKITKDMNLIEMLDVMSEGNPGAINVLKNIMEDENGLLSILVLDSLDIRGSKLWALYNDSCNKNKKKFKRTLKVLNCGVYSHEEIQNNLSAYYPVPFIDDSIKIKGVPTYDEDFGPGDPKWNEFVSIQRRINAPLIKEVVKMEKKLNKSLFK